MSDCCCGGCSCHSNNKRDRKEEVSVWKRYRVEGVTALLMIAGMAFRTLLPGIIAPLYFLVVILPVGVPIVVEMWESWRRGSFMNEYTLMVAATVGAFIIGEYPEAVAVLLFYSFGEKMEDSASEDVRNRIRALLGKLPDKGRVKQADGIYVEVSPAEVKVGSVLLVKPGERVPIDSTLLGDGPVEFDTSAITGESVPRSYRGSEELPSGIIPVDKAVEVRTLRPFSDSSMSRIMEMIESAQSSKSESETMLRRITRWYTPLVFCLALLLFAVPGFVSVVRGVGFDWMMWLQRSLILLVCSCPCALVVSIPLSYFASLGSASKAGLLFKGSRFVDGMRDVDTVIFDKTGTLTTGSFHVSQVETVAGVSQEEVLGLAGGLDRESAHPLARAILEDVGQRGLAMPEVKGIQSVPHGMEGEIEGERCAAGSRKLMSKLGIEVPALEGEGTEICVARGGRFLGAIYLQDTVKPEAKEAVSQLHRLGVRDVKILSGDREEAVSRVAREVGADSYGASLLPGDKHDAVRRAVSEGHRVAFVGDGVNDAPAIAMATVGVAMGTMGSDLAMDSADVVIAGDNLMKLPLAVSLARKVRRVVIQNVGFAIGVKALVMLLGAIGVASLWAAVFADTGVTLLTIAWVLISLRKA